MLKGSAVGDKAATKKKMVNIQILHGFKIVLPRRNPIKLNATRKIGSSKASPTKRMTLRTKSK